MDDLGFFFCVLLFIYLTDCVIWGRSDCYFFRKTLKRHWLQSHPKLFPLFGAYALLFKSVVPSTGFIVVSQRFPLVVTIKGFCAKSTDFIHPALHRSDCSPGLEFAMVKHFCQDGKLLVANNRPVLKASSEAYARWLASVLEKIRKSSPDLRSQEIEKQVANMFDTKSLEQRLSECEQAIKRLRPGCILLFVLLFLVAPSATTAWGLTHTWKLLLAAVFGNSLLIACVFYVVHRRIYPLLVGHRIIMATTLFFSPPAAIRAEDLILRDAFSDWHPLAVAGVLSGKDALPKTVAGILRETLFSKTFDPTDNHGVESSWRLAEIRYIDEFIRRLGTTSKQLLQPPTQQSLKSSRYCPRCLCQYVNDIESCNDCGVKLIPF